MPRMMEYLSLFAKLPKYTGPYRVSCHDIEWFGGSGRQHRGASMTSTETATHPEDADKELAGEKEPLLVRLYYPAEPTGHEHQATWLPPPSYVYGQGYSEFLGIPRLISIPFIASIVRFTKLPACMDAPVATRLPEDEDKESPPPAKDHPYRFPVVVFSHGLGGCRTTYSGICGELASHGFVVCAIEHRDGTASVTSLDKGKRTIPYRRPKRDEDEYRMRRGQIHHRLGEVHSAWELLERLDSGDAVDNCLEESAATLNNDDTNVAMSNGFDQKQLKNRLDLNRAAMAGHSFGGATTIEALREPGTPYKCGVAFDPWMFAVSKEVNNNGTTTNDKDDQRAKPTPPPIMAINSQAFTKWSQNYNILRDHMIYWNGKQRESSAATKQQQQEDANAHSHRTLEQGIYGPSWLFTVRNSEHPHQSDFALLLGSIVTYIPFAKIGDPAQTLGLNTQVCLEFLRHTLPACPQKLDSLRIPIADNIITSNTSIIPERLLVHRLDGTVGDDEKKLLKK
ncbi:platelet-activating factor acetylhydrolase [Syncephalis plumigaleata]|nr:platelet-activating factor acetylhydrolase [Syncephalis plumigaleata]